MQGHKWLLISTYSLTTHFIPLVMGGLTPQCMLLQTKPQPPRFNFHDGWWSSCTSCLWRGLTLMVPRSLNPIHLLHIFIALAMRGLHRQSISQPTKTMSSPCFVKQLCIVSMMSLRRLSSASRCQLVRTGATGSCDSTWRITWLRRPSLYCCSVFHVLRRNLDKNSWFQDHTLWND